MSAAKAKGPASSISNDQLIRFYQQMVAIRLFEERVNDLYTRALMPGLAHLYIGEEAIAVGVCEALNADDYVTSTHRGHGHCLAKGAKPDLMFAELLGKEAGYCKGKGGSMHIADPGTGNMGANAIVGGSAGIATGAAYASKYLKTGRVAICFFGEGALGQGLLYEEMNLAQLWRLPVIFVCENNQYAISVPQSKQMAVKDVASRAEGYGFPGVVVDGRRRRTPSGAGQTAPHGPVDAHGVERPGGARQEAAVGAQAAGKMAACGGTRRRGRPLAAASRQNAAIV